MIDKIRKQGAEDIVKAVIKEHNMHELSDKYAVAVSTPFGQLRALEIRHDKMKRLLVEIIQILDYSFTKEVQDAGFDQNGNLNAIGLIRSKVDNLLNKGE